MTVSHFTNYCVLFNVEEEFSLGGQGLAATVHLQRLLQLQTPPPWLPSFRSEIQFTKRVHVVNIRLDFK